MGTYFFNLRNYKESLLEGLTHQRRRTRERNSRGVQNWLAKYVCNWVGSISRNGTERNAGLFHGTDKCDRGTIILLTHSARDIARARKRPTRN